MNKPLIAVAIGDPAGIGPEISVRACASRKVTEAASCNDSYFWVVNRTLGVKEVKDQIMTYSVTSTIAWAVGFVEILILSIFIR